MASWAGGIPSFRTHWREYTRPPPIPKSPTSRKKVGASETVGPTSLYDQSEGEVGGKDLDQVILPFGPPSSVFPHLGGEPN